VILADEDKDREKIASKETISVRKLKRNGSK
jgi:hypothetical protein